jgi:antitoxin (DNA-binding transcriptional repressor) of toxin-antitoxin stability system
MIRTKNNQTLLIWSEFTSRMPWSWNLRSSTLVHLVEQGQTVSITNRGSPVVNLVPAQGSCKSDISALIGEILTARNCWRGKKKAESEFCTAHRCNALRLLAPYRCAPNGRTLASSGRISKA